MVIRSVNVCTPRYSRGMAELIPELRPDYTGKMVTRHVKSSPAKQALRIAAPTIATPKPTVKEMSVAVADALSVAQREVDDNFYPEDRLEKLLYLVSRHDFRDASLVLLDGVACIEDTALDPCLALLDRHQERVAELIAQAPAESEIMAPYTPLVITGMNCHAFAMTPEQETTLVEAVTRIWSHSFINNNPEYHQAVFPDRLGWRSMTSMGGVSMNDDLAQYVVNNPDKLDAIVYIITEREITDPDAIDAMATSTSPLLDGVL